MGVGSSRWSLDSSTPLEGKRKDMAERKERRGKQRERKGIVKTLSLI